MLGAGCWEPGTEHRPSLGGRSSFPQTQLLAAGPGGTGIRGAGRAARKLGPRTCSPPAPTHPACPAGAVPGPCSPRSQRDLQTTSLPLTQEAWPPLAPAAPGSELATAPSRHGTPNMTLSGGAPWRRHEGGAPASSGPFCHVRTWRDTVGTRRVGTPPLTPGAAAPGCRRAALGSQAPATRRREEHTSAVRPPVCDYSLPFLPFKRRPTGGSSSGHLSGGTLRSPVRRWAEAPCTRVDSGPLRK